MWIGPILAFYSTELNKLVMQKLRIEIMSLSYHPLHLAGIFIGDVSQMNITLQLG
jgi:hypothetical protein